MAFTFGAAVTDSIASSGLNSSIFGTNRVSLVCCWVYPTTLTATRVVFGTSAVYTLAIDTTTTSLRLTLDAVTTDAVYTFPAGLAINTWTFVAVAWCMGTGPAAAVRAWTATESTGPIERTVTNATAGVSTWNAGGSTFTLGNASAGSLAFQGDLGGLVVMVDSQTTNLNAMCGIISSSSAITQAQADALLAAYVTPIWKGDLGPILGMGRQINNSSVNQLGFALAMSCDTGIVGGNVVWTQRAGVQNTRFTATGATSSARRTPHSFDDQDNNLITVRGGVARSYLIRT